MGIRRCVLPLALLFSCSPVCIPQSNDWALIQQVPPGQRVKVVTADGRFIAGPVQSVTEEGIQVGARSAIQKQDVRRVLIRRRGHRGRHALIGLGVGAAAGLGLGIAAGCDTSGGQWCFIPRGPAIGVMTPLVGGLGAGIGALLPAGGGWREVYRQP